MYEHDVSPVQVAHRLRVSTKSAYQWRRRWRSGGETALMSKGAGGAACRLSAGQLGRLRAALEGGPAVENGKQMASAEDIEAWCRTCGADAETLEELLRKRDEARVARAVTFRNRMGRGQAKVQQT